MAARKRARIDDEDEDEYIQGAQGYDMGEEYAEEEDTKAGIVHAKHEGGGPAVGAGMVPDRASKELIRYMVGVHSQGKPIAREKLEKVLVDVKLFDEKETKKGAKLAGELAKCVPHLKHVFGYRLAKFDRTLRTDPFVLDFKEKEYVLETALGEEYDVANNGTLARGPVSEENFMAYVVASLVTLVVQMGTTDYHTFTTTISSMGLSHCLHKGKIKNTDEMIGQLCKSDYLTLFPTGGAFLPTSQKLPGAAKPSNKLTVMKDCKDLGLGHKDAEKAEVTLGPKMYYEFDALGVYQVFEDVRNGNTTESRYEGLRKKIQHCKFQGPAGEEQQEEVEEDI